MAFRECRFKPVIGVEQELFRLSVSRSSLAGKLDPFDATVFFIRCKVDEPVSNEWFQGMAKRLQVHNHTERELFHWQPVVLMDLS